MGVLGLVPVYSNKELEERAKRTRAVVESYEDSTPVTALTAHIEKFWQSAQYAKQQIERRMLANLRQRNGVYEPDELAQIRSEGSSEIFMMLTSAKCRGFESWMRDVLLPDIGKPWGLEPMPMPDLPPMVSQSIVQAVTVAALQAGWDIDDRRVDAHLNKLKFLAIKKMKDLARKIADRHELKIEDQFVKGGWEQALSDCIYDFATWPCCIMKGPVVRMRKARQWIPGPKGYWYPQVVDELRPEYLRRSPLDIFPAARARNIQQYNLIDRYFFTREDLQALKGVPRFSADAIDQVIEAYGIRGYRTRMSQDSERAYLELRQNEMYDPEQDIETHNFWGSVSGRMLMNWGFTYKKDLQLIGLGEKIDPNKEYQIEAWRVGRFTIMAQVNPNPLGERPYDKASFEEVPDSFWGKGIPEVMADCQKMCNGAARAIANNASVASGPQTEVNVDRVAKGESLTQVYPWKLWQTVTDMTGNNQPAVRFFQPQMNVQELLVIYNAFSVEADNVTGVPKYSYGDSKVSGAGRTSSGLAQLLGAAGKGIRRSVAAMDRGVVRAKVTRQYDYNMEWDTDVSIKFGLRAQAKGAAALLVKADTAMRQREMLQATANPLDASIIGPKGRREMLRPALKNADFPVEDILPDDLELELIMATLPKPHELVAGGGGPNGPSGAPAGQSGDGGGTPEGAAAVDEAGMRPNGVDQRQATSGYRDGGVIRKRGPLYHGYDNRDVGRRDPYFDNVDKGV